MNGLKFPRFSFFRLDTTFAKSVSIPKSFEEKKLTEGYFDTHRMVRWLVDLFINGRRRESVFRLKHFWWVEILKDGHNTTTIPVIGHTATIVDMTCCIFQNLSHEQKKKRRNIDPQSHILHNSLSTLLGIY